jgi:peptidoglycan/xylan/chitin deacetylase (PgdA/CDA1 family)
VRPAPRWGALVAAAVVAGTGSTPAVAAPPQGPSVASVPILVYHRVGSSPRFARQVAALSRHGYRAVTLGRVVRAWRGEATLPRRPIVLSFDDGYLSQYRTAVRILRARGWPGVLNLQVERLGVAGGLTRTQVRRMIAAGWELDSHSITHPDLTTVGPERLRRELVGSREALQREFAVSADFFCFPYGRFDAAVQAAVRSAGYLGATTAHRGLATPGGDRYELPRIGVPAGATPARLMARLREAAAPATF